MAKLIPGKVRSQGSLLYEAGKVSLQEVKEKYLYFRVEEESLRYSLDDDAVFCSCAFFQKKKFCTHLAAVEAFLKNDDSGKAALASLEEDATATEETQEKVSFGSLFLDQVLPKIEKKETRYVLSAVGQEDEYSGQFLWTLRIRRLPDERSYVIRDVLAFLQTLQKEGHFAIGKSYYEPISYLEFDGPSQDVINFLQGLVTDGGSKEQDFFPNAGRHLYFPPTLFEEAVELLMNLDSFLLQYSLYDFSEVYFQDVHGEEDLFHFQVADHGDFYELIITEPQVKVVESAVYLFRNGVFYHLTPQQRTLWKAIQDLPMDQDRKKRLHFDPTDQTKLSYSLKEFKKLGQITAPTSFLIHDFTPEFYFDLAQDQTVLLDVVFQYEDRVVTTREELLNLPYSSDFDKEQEVFSTMLAAGFTDDFSSQRSPLSSEQIYPFFHQQIPTFEALGEVTLSDSLLDLYQVERPKIDVKTNGSLLEIGFDFESVDPAEVDQVLKALVGQKDYFVSHTGKVLVFDEETKKISRALADLRAKMSKGGKLQARRIAAYQLADLLADQDNVHFSEDFQNLAHDLTHPEDYQLPQMTIQATLRDYQETGVKWFSMLNHYGFGGILADDMGLGKTLQTISFLTSVAKKETKILILAPSSLIYNWKQEFSKFAPKMEVAVVYGLKQHRDELIATNPQVVITSYASFRQDVEEYQKNQYEYLILDEAQVMKNAQTKIAQHLRGFEVPHVFALSGTPIENHVGELWSIFQIVLPGLFPAKKEFQKLSPETIARFVKPFVMRRKKDEVLQELPDLIETTYHNELDESQKTIYLAQLKKIQDRVRTSSEEELNRSKVEILSGLMRLRQICDTPALFMEDYQGDSGKLESLRDLLGQIKDGEHRVLIFSQFRGMLDILEQEIDQLGMTSFKITGSTPAKDRQEMTNAFNAGERHSFLISLKAGGVGLNLTGADTVILVDLWWNPAVEDQAIGRAHRMGQEQNVEVYRMITRGTIEEKIQELQASKRHLVSTILDGTETRSSLSVEEIREILGIPSE